jgi:hypothetical protein
LLNISNLLSNTRLLLFIRFFFLLSFLQIINIFFLIYEIQLYDPRFLSISILSRFANHYNYLRDTKQWWSITKSPFWFLNSAYCWVACKIGLLPVHLLHRIPNPVKKKILNIIFFIIFISKQNNYIQASKQWPMITVLRSTMPQDVYSQEESWLTHWHTASTARHHLLLPMQQDSLQWYTTSHRIFMSM